MRVACLSCGARDVVDSVSAIRPAGDWTCSTCDWGTAKQIVGDQNPRAESPGGRPS